MLPYAWVPVARLTTISEHLWSQKLNGDILLGNENLDRAGQHGWVGRRWRELTGSRTFFSVMSFQVMLGNGIVSELLRKQVIVVLLGETAAAGPTLEPGSVHGIFLPQMGKSKAGNRP